MSIHAVLGANGAIGTATLNAIRSKNLEARPLTRTEADARSAAQLIEALNGTEVVYCCIGLP